MKKNLFFIGTAALLLSACGGQENPEEAVTGEAEEKAADGAVRSLSSDVTKGASGEYKIHEQEVDHAQPAGDPSGYEELVHVEDHFAPKDYEILVANDNPENRVLLFMDGETPMYKTVYIKNEGLLKLISTEDGLIEETKI